MDKTLPLGNDNDVSEPFLPKNHILKGRYEVLRVLGNGGFGVTYECRDKTLDLKVAVKEYYPDGFVSRDCKKSPVVTYTATSENKIFVEKGMHRFLDEARVLAKFSGEFGIVDVRDYFEENNTAYIVMEFLNGKDLKELIQEKGRLPAEYAVRLLLPVMESLEKIHRQGLIHRDISPDNIRMAGNRLKLLDFGAARSFSYEGNRTMTVMLKRGYAPIEQYGEVDAQGPWTDVYALCATLYLCITGKKPADSLIRWDRDPLQKPSQLGIAISPALEEVIMKGLSVSARNRYQSMRELVDALKTALTKAPAKSLDATVRINPAPNKRQQPIEPHRPIEPQRPIEKSKPKVQSWQTIVSEPEGKEKEKKSNKNITNHKKKTKLFIPIIAVVVVFAILAGVFIVRDYIFGVGYPDSEVIVADISTIQSNGVIKVGITESPPIKYIEKGDWIGFDTEFAQAFAERLGVEVEFVEINETDPEHGFTALQAGDIDCILNSMIITEYAQTNLSFSDFYAQISQVVVLPVDKAVQVVNIEDLREYTFAVEEGSACQAIAEENELNTIPTFSMNQALNEVKNGTCNGCIIANTIAEASVGVGTSNENLAIALALNIEEYGVAFRHNSDLTAEFNAFLEEYRSNGELARLAEKYEVEIR